MVNYIGYKAFDQDLKCKDMQYEIGKKYEMDDDIEMCQRGFHFCANLRDVFEYYPVDARICIVKSYGDIKEDLMKWWLPEEICKYCTNKIEILSEIEVSIEDRIKYLYACHEDLDNEELKELLKEEFDPDKFIKIEDTEITEALYKYGYIDDNALIFSKNTYDRALAANLGLGLDKLLLDDNIVVANMAFMFLKKDPEKFQKIIDLVKELY